MIFFEPIRERRSRDSQLTLNQKKDRQTPSRRARMWVLASLGLVPSGAIKPAHENSAQIFNKLPKAKCGLTWGYRSPWHQRHMGISTCLLVLLYRKQISLDAHKNDWRQGKNPKEVSLLAQASESGLAATVGKAWVLPRSITKLKSTPYQLFSTFPSQPLAQVVTIYFFTCLMSTLPTRLNSPWVQYNAWVFFHNSPVPNV